MNCGGRYHAFNNEDRNNQAQVNELLDKMDELVIRNEGRHYTNEFSEDQRWLNWCKTAIILGAVCGIGVVVAVKWKK